jgi:hypothetical protein
MFFKKKKSILEENVAKQGIKKIDRVVTWLLLWGIIASIYGVKKLRQKENGEEHSEHHDEHDTHEQKEHHQSEQEKQSLLSRLFFGNK